ncbi:MAG: hypothetical protein M0P70_04790 [Desulfobulbaceae bacterium]|nr:hypothetical protein [Desulfobulbaceae bacterium]
MKPNELKTIRKAMGARQQDLVKVLGIPLRTYQNWEQPEESREHRSIPDEFADRVRSLAELKADQGGTAYPNDLIWLQIPVRKPEMEALKRKAMIADKNLSTLVRDVILEIRHHQE